MTDTQIFLDPSISKEPFNLEEDTKILELHLEKGSRWTCYTQYLPGRSADGIKNRYNSKFK